MNAAEKNSQAAKGRSTLTTLLVILLLADRKSVV